MRRFLQGLVAGGLVWLELGLQKLVALSSMILRTPHIKKQFVYSQMSLKSELWFKENEFRIQFIAIGYETAFVSVFLR